MYKSFMIAFSMNESYTIYYIDCKKSQTSCLNSVAYSFNRTQHLLRYRKLSIFFHWKISNNDSDLQNHKLAVFTDEGY